jgi:hexosaminidase
MIKKMMMPLLFAIVGMIGFTACQQQPNTIEQFTVIPMPNSVEPGVGQFTLNEKTVFLADDANEEVSHIMADWNRWINKSTGFSTSIAADASTNYIQLILDENYQSDKAGAYACDIQSDYIQIKSNSSIGLYYGMQTLRQLLPAQLESSTQVNADWTLPVGRINDEPRFSYRGLHLDVCRHFYPVSFIKKFIDLLAMHKMNVFHWHLTEDQGWRIEIKKYPLLTEVGSIRKETIIGHLGDSKGYDGKEYGGYYTQEEVKEIVKYAQERFVTIIPEIELPGHSLGALTAYPHLGCTGGPYEVATKWGIFDDVYCAGNEEVFTFLEDVLDEVIELFPSKYIHIGGDECPKGAWEKCPKCQKRIKAEGLKNEHELQSYFITRMEKYLASKGRSIIGWDEILEGGLAPNATVMSWRGEKGGIEAANQHHNVVMTPGHSCYLDIYQKNTEEEQLAIGGLTTTLDCYSYNPIPDELTTEEAKYVLGVQGNLWSEYIPTTEHLEYMAYPRACALAEVGWTHLDNKDWNGFAARLANHFERFDLIGLNYFNKIQMPVAHPQKVQFLEEGTIELRNNAIGATIYYTTDGSEPTVSSNVYKDGLTFDKTTTVKAVAIDAKGAKSAVMEVTVEQLIFNEATMQPGENKGLAGELIEGKFRKCAKVVEQNGKPVKTAMVELPEGTPKKYFGLVLNGHITVPEKGVYTFYIKSDDGSQLFINEKLVADNDGNHGMRTKSGKVALLPGTHQLQVIYFQGSGGKGVSLMVETPSGEKMPVPAEWLTY